MKIDERIIERCQKLIEKGEAVRSTRRRPPANVASDDYVDAEPFHEWRVSALSFLRQVFGEGSDYYRNFGRVEHPYLHNAIEGIAILKAAKNEFEAGFFASARKLIAAEVFDDFVEQAEHLLASGFKDPAAVLIGATLEDAMRRICDAHGVSITPTEKVDSMNSKLAKAGVYNVLIQKQVTAWADLRNKAAHGRVAEYKREDVEEMLRGVRRFVADYLT